MVLDGKTALITGAARGIGRAIALRFASEGAAVGLIDLKSTDELARSLEAQGLEGFALELDITDPERVRETFDEVARQRGVIDILVNNAGIIARGTILELGHETWRRVLEVNLNGTFNCCKAAIPHMVRQKSGRILNISSIAGKMGDITAAPAYGTSKGAINTFTRSLARQLAEHGITVNGIAPHAIETDMSAEWSEEKRREVIGGIPLKRMGRPEDVAEAALFLVSEAASFITGEVLNVNGGALMD
ncbi:MAG: SDR family oxidoreductase [Spirochaetales bacterium]|nr:SDR family oxidoreductase [Spirochaetales bacterium]